MVGRQPYAPSAFTPGEIPGTHFSEAELTPGHMVPSKPWKKAPATPSGIDPVSVRPNHYATPGQAPANLINNDTKMIDYKMKYKIHVKYTLTFKAYWLRASAGLKLNN